MAEQEKPKRKGRGPWSPEERAKREEYKRLRAEGKLPPTKKVGHLHWTEEQKEQMKKTLQANNARKEKEEWEAAQGKLAVMRREKLEALKLEPMEEGVPKDNSRYLREARVGYNLPPIDISDPAQVEQRINEYLDFCEINNKRPHLVGLSNWIGVTSRQILRWQNGECRSGSVAKILQKYRSLLEEFMVDQIQDTKNNPANWIFLLKNMFGYKDQTDIVVGPTEPNEQNMSKEDLEKWFLEDGKKIDTTFADGEE